MRNPWYIIFIATLVFGGSWIWANQVPIDAAPSTREPQPAVGHPAPDFTLTTLEGAEFRLSDELETPIVLNFWATWCGPCRRELPALQATFERFDGEVLIVGVDQAEDPATVQKFVDELGLSFVIPLDEKTAISRRYKVVGLPTTFFIDRNGIIQRIWSGEMNNITLAENIAEIVP